jgi:hypothetical protein
MPADKWLKVFTTLAVVIALASFVGLFGNRPYIGMIAIWLSCVAVFSQVKKLFPGFPENGVIFAWMLLVVFGLILAWGLLAGVLVAPLDAARHYDPLMPSR